MRIYLASGFRYMGHYNLEENLKKWGLHNRMYSYYYVKTRKAYNQTFNEILKNTLFENILVDSGAFSISTVGGEIPIIEYADWLSGIKDKVSYINLDVIPKDIADLERTADMGWENLKYLESRGLKPIPVYRLSEPKKWLERIMDNYEYFCLSKTSVAQAGKKNILLSLDQCWKKLTDRQGKPLRKVHGLALTSIPLMSRYPWFSVDSSTWGRTGVFGHIMFPQKLSHGREASHGIVAVSEHSLGQRVKFSHYLTLSDEERRIIDDYLNSLGLNIELVSTDTDARDEVNVKYFLDLEKKLTSERGKCENLIMGFF